MKYIVIGGSQGIGAETIKNLNIQGHYTINISRKANDIANENHSIDILTDELPSIEGGIDGIVYCPGSINLKPFRGLKPDDFLADFNINVMGAVKTLQHFLPNLQASPTASVVLFSTVAVGTGMPFHASVASAKGALEGLTRALAAEWASKIRVNAIAPSLTDTPLAGRLLDTDAKKLSAAERHPTKSYGQAEDIAAMAVHLLLPVSKFITGQIIKIDGGMSGVRV